MFHALRLVLLSGMCVGTAFADGPTIASGVVYLDSNGDGVRQSGERGIPGVAVSDGVRVVLTDGEGRWELPVTGDDHFFVIKPRGYRTPVNGHGIPQFSYIHKPDGSPDDDFIWPGVEPTGDLPDSIDFPLTPSAEPDSFKIIVMGDPQPYSEREVDYYRADIIDPILGRHDLAFGVSLGDLVGDRLDLFEPLNQAQSLFGVPWYNVYGNHDMNFMSGQSTETASDPDRWSDETFERVYGPATYAFQFGRVHFINLDSVIHEGFKGFRNGTFESWPGGKWPRTSTYRGGLREDQLNFIENYLEIVPKDELVVLLMHIPLSPHSHFDSDSIHQIPERGRLLEVLSSHPHTFSMSGHTHIQRHWFYGEDEGYRPDAPNQHARLNNGRSLHHHLNAVTASGSWYRGLFDEQLIPHTQMRCGAPNGYTLVHFDGNRYTTDFMPARRHESDQAHITIGEPGSTEVKVGSDNTSAVVNIYNGSERDRVMWRIVPGTQAAANPTPWSVMAFAPQVDPTYRALFDREKELAQHAEGQRDLPDPIAAHRIWEVTLPTDLPVGTHRFEVRHTDLYGREWTYGTSFRVAAD